MLWWPGIAWINRTGRDIDWVYPRFRHFMISPLRISIVHIRNCSFNLDLHRQPRQSLNVLVRVLTISAISLDGSRDLAQLPDRCRCVLRLFTTREAPTFCRAQAQCVPNRLPSPYLQVHFPRSILTVSGLRFIDPSSVSCLASLRLAPCRGPCALLDVASLMPATGS